MIVIGHVENEYAEKFGIPRQSGLVNQVKSRIVFEKEYRVADAFKGLEGFSHLWIIWDFSEAHKEKWSPTVRPPVLGGNARVGVFATRSPFRPNPIGLSSVKLEQIVLEGPDAPYIIVSGADLMNGTPVLDIKPYLAYADSHPDAVDGFASEGKKQLKTVYSDENRFGLSEEEADKIASVIAQDPRPAYQQDSERVYGFSFGAYNIKFKVDGDTAVITEISGGNNG